MIKRVSTNNTQLSDLCSSLKLAKSCPTLIRGIMRLFVFAVVIGWHKAHMMFVLFRADRL